MEEAPTREWKNAKVVFGCFGWGIVKKSSDAASPVSFTLSRIRFIEPEWIIHGCGCNLIASELNRVGAEGAFSLRVKANFQRKPS